MRTWRTGVMRTIQVCLASPLGTDTELARAVRVDRTYHFDVAWERKEELLERVEDTRSRRIAARWLLSIGDAGTCLRLLFELENEVDLLAKRFQRVRNGIQHGTPPSAGAVASVMDFSRYRVFGALWYAMEAATGDRSMRELLDERRAHRAVQQQKLRRGIGLVQQWSGR